METKQNSNDKKKGGNDLKTEPPSRRHSPPNRENREVKPSNDTAQKAVKAVCFTKSAADKTAKKYTFRQGTIAPDWWKVPPVIVIGEVNYTAYKISQKNKKNTLKRISASDYYLR